MPMPQLPKIREKLPLIIAIACGVLALLFMNIYMQNRETEIMQKVKQIKGPAQPQQPQQKMGLVLIAQRDIPPQVPIAPEDLLMKEMPVEFIQPGAVTTLDAVIGQISSVPISAGEQIIITKLLAPGKISKSLSEITPEGKRAVSVPVDNISGLIGLLQPGDSVDVYVSLATPPTTNQTYAVTKLLPLFQGVKVLAVGTDFSSTGQTTKREQTKQQAAGPGTVTLALGPQEAILLTFVQEQQGKIKLVLRSDVDTSVEPIRAADWETLQQYLYPSTTAKPGKQPVVEIYRGQQKEVVPLSEGTKKE